VAPKVQAAQVALDLPEGGWGYCTEFLVEGSGLDIDVIRDQIEALGNSVMVVGEPSWSSPRSHGRSHARDHAGRKLRQGAEAQRRRHVHPAQAHPRERGRRRERGRHGQTGSRLVAVVAGNGLVEIFRGAGVDAIVEGGQTMNPSTQDMLLAIASVPYQEVVLLPNNRTVILAAKQVAGLTQKRVHILETRSVPEGVAAVVSFRPDRSGAENVAAMKGEAERVQTIEVTHAVRDTRSNGLKVKKGDVIGLINEKLEFAGSDYADVVNKAPQLGPNSI
jgi:dihydroxyacetone kinase-like predicted kinase